MQRAGQDGAGALSYPGIAEEGAMDGNEVRRRVARLRAEGRARASFAVLHRGQPEATAATAAECVASAKEPLRRFDALRRRPGTEPLPAWWAARPGGGALTGGRWRAV